MRFSERNGYRKVRDRIQLESMDDELRISLWNVLTATVFQQPDEYLLSAGRNARLRKLAVVLYAHHFKEPIDSIPQAAHGFIALMRERFFDGHWYEAYDFLEFVNDNQDSETFADMCNGMMERESAGYRFVNGLIAPITDSAEIDAIETAARDAPSPVRVHLDRALELLTSRESPDYRNSVKESISAVESLAALTLGVDKGTLGQLLTRLEEHGALHPALKTAFSKLYGYSSDQGGVRHALLDRDGVTHAEAQFMLVTCSAFVNYVKQRDTSA